MFSVSSVKAAVLIGRITGLARPSVCLCGTDSKLENKKGVEKKTKLA